MWMKENPTLPVPSVLKTNANKNTGLDINTGTAFTAAIRIAVNNKTEQINAGVTGIVARWRPASGGPWTFVDSLVYGKQGVSLAGDLLPVNAAVSGYQGYLSVGSSVSQYSEIAWPLLGNTGGLNGQDVEVQVAYMSLKGIGPWTATLGPVTVPPNGIDPTLTAPNIFVGLTIGRAGLDDKLVAVQPSPMAPDRVVAYEVKVVRQDTMAVVQNVRVYYAKSYPNAAGLPFGLTYPQSSFDDFKATNGFVYLAGLPSGVAVTVQLRVRTLTHHSPWSVVSAPVTPVGPWSGYAA